MPHYICYYGNARVNRVILARQQTFNRVFSWTEDTKAQHHRELALERNQNRNVQIAGAIFSHRHGNQRGFVPFCVTGQVCVLTSSSISRTHLDKRQAKTNR